MLRCDWGTNFIGGKPELVDATRELDQLWLERYAKEQGCEWLFNPLMPLTLEVCRSDR